MILYHGTRSILPFNTFDTKNIYRGIVTSSATPRHKGYYFTSDVDNAAYFTEWLICRCEISIVNGMTYKENILDGQFYSNVLFVPETMVHHIQILDWFIISDRTYYRQELQRQDLFCKELPWQLQKNYINPYNVRFNRISSVG